MLPVYNVLIVDDEDNIRWSIRNYVYEEYNIHFYEAANAQEALDMLSRYYIDFVLLDIMLPDRNGLEILEEIKRRYFSTQVIIVTAYATVADVVSAIKRGATDYIQKPFTLEDLKIKIYRAIELDNIQHSLASIFRSEKGQVITDPGIVAKDQKMLTLLKYGEALAQQNVNCVLITGETGTGKEEFANFIHRSSPTRSSGPFVTVNCNSLTSSLMDMELFGYERGAFTDAKTKKEGLFKTADKGIIFLDEIGDMHPELQGKLLRVLEKKVSRKIGGVQDETLDTMVILATNKNLRQLVDAGGFRRDLYFRINAFEIHIPPLRERKGDILPLAYFFVEKYNKAFNKNFTHISKELEKIFLEYKWPGNVRELKNVVEHIVMLAQGNEIVTSMFGNRLLNGDGNNIVGGEVDPDSFNDIKSLDAFYMKSKINLITRVVEVCNWNVSAAAEKLGMDRSTLNYTINKYGIRKKSEVKGQ